METETTPARPASKAPPRRSRVNPRPPQAIVGTPQAASRGGRGRLLLLVLAAVAVGARLRVLPGEPRALWLRGGVFGARGPGVADFPGSDGGSRGLPPPGPLPPPPR